MGRQSRPPPFPGARGFPFPTQGAGADFHRYLSLAHQELGESLTSGRLPQPPLVSRLRHFQLFPLLSSRLSARLTACLFYFPRQ